MGLKLRYAPAALRDIDAIRNYLAAENPAAAERVRLSILKAIQPLPSFLSWAGPDGKKARARKPSRGFLI